MEESPGTKRQRILKIAEMRQGFSDEIIELLQGFGPVQRPAKALCTRLAKAGNAGLPDALPEHRMIVLAAPVGRLMRQAGPGFAVVVIEIPPAAQRLAGAGHQHAMTHPHLAVKMFHQPLLALGEKQRGFVAAGVEVFAIDHPTGDGELAGVVGKLPVKPPFVGCLILESTGRIVGDQRIQIGR